MGSKRELCVHILFVMLRIFRVPATHEMLGKTALSEYELSQLIDRQFVERERRIQAPASSTSSFLARTRSRLSASSSTAGESDTAAKAVSSAAVAPKPLSADDCCPICQEELQVSEALTYCQSSCGNHIHAKCMEVWAKNCVDTRQAATNPISCPLCRSKWHVATMDELRMDLSLAASKQSGAAAGSGKSKKSVQSSLRLNLLCSSCAAPITHVHFRCVLCPTYDSCGVCFRRQRHPRSHAMVRRHEGQRDAAHWEVAVAPQNSHEGIARQRQEILAALQHRELTMADYDLLLQLDASGSVTMHEHLASTLPRYEPPPVLTQQPAAHSSTSEDAPMQAVFRSLMPQAPPSAPAQPVCCVCGISTSTTASSAFAAPSFSRFTALPVSAGGSGGSSSGLTLRLLPACGHVAHHRCLIDQFVYDCNASCPLCAVVILPGLDAVNLKKSKRRDTAAITDAIKSENASALALSSSSSHTPAISLSTSLSIGSAFRVTGIGGGHAASRGASSLSAHEAAAGASSSVSSSDRGPFALSARQNRNQHHQQLQNASLSTFDLSSTLSVNASSSNLHVNAAPSAAAVLVAEAAPAYSSSFLPAPAPNVPLVAVLRRNTEQRRQARGSTSTVQVWTYRSTPWPHHCVCSCTVLSCPKCFRISIQHLVFCFPGIHRHNSEYFTSSCARQSFFGDKHTFCCSVCVCFCCYHRRCFRFCGSRGLGIFELSLCRVANCIS